MRYLILLLGAAAAAGAGSAHALSFDAAYEADRERETGIASTGFSAGLSQALGNYFFIGVNYAQLRTEPFYSGDLRGRLEYRSAGASLGVGIPMSPRVDLGLSAGYAGSETHGLDDFADDPVHRVDGPVGSVTFVIHAHKWIAFYIGPSYSYLGRVPGWNASAGLRLKLLRTVSFNAGYWGAEDIEGWHAGLGKYFGAD